MKINTLMQHSIGASTKANAAKLSMNSIQGHYHSNAEIVYAGDPNMLRWSMTVGCLMDIHSIAARYMRHVVLRRPIVCCGLLLSPQENTLVISDMHMPYHHKDVFKFLLAVKKKYKPKNILCTGDLIDHHTGSYHETEPDALSPEEEYWMARKALLRLKVIFPKMVVTNGNHDEIPKRKLKTVGLPSAMVADYNKLYDLGQGWEWLDSYEFNCGNAKPVLCPMPLRKSSRWNGEVI